MSDAAPGPVAEAPAVPSGRFVFVTVGTDHHPFDRLIEACEAWSSRAGLECFIQFGTSRPPTGSGAAYLPYPSMVSAMETATAVVCHGGPATIMLARQSGRVPIVVPRDPLRGEHVDGHQQEFSRWMAAKKQVFLAETTQDLERHLDAAIADPDAYRVSPEDDETVAAVRRFAQIVDDLLDERKR